MIDLCVSLSGPHLDLLLPLYLQTLVKKCDLSEVRLHLVDRGCQENVRQYLRDFAGREGAAIHAVPQSFMRTFGSNPEPLENIAHDTAGICQWMLDNCGHCEWVFISHFDLIFFEDALAEYRAFIADNVGQIGSHEVGMVGYSRKAVQHSGARFDNLDGLRLAKDEHGKWRLRYVGDLRCPMDAMDITGLDVGEWLELHLQLNGWSVKPMPLDNPKMRHSRCGSAYHGDATKEASRWNAILAMNELGIQPIP